MKPNKTRNESRKGYTTARNAERTLRITTALESGIELKDVRGWG